jgi:hypothetical protein
MKELTLKEFSQVYDIKQIAKAFLKYNVIIGERYGYHTFFLQHKQNPDVKFVCTPEAYRFNTKELIKHFKTYVDIYNTA